MTFTEALRAELSDNWRDTEFTYCDFANIAAEYGKNLKSITHVLRDMEEKHLLYVVGTKCRHGGGSPTKRYRVTAGAELRVTPLAMRHVEYVRLKLEAEEKMVCCANRLQAWLDGIGASRSAM